MTALPSGFAVLVTRPVRQAEPLCKLIEEFGGQAVRFPLLEIVPAEESDAGPRRLRCLENLDWLIFVSANAVRCAFELLGPQWLAHNAPKIAAIGQATAGELAARGVAVDLKPKQQFNSESLLAQPEWADVAGKKFLIVRGEGGRELLADALRQRGGGVEYAEVYRRLPPRADAEDLLSRWRAGGIAAVTVTSGEALDHLSELMKGNDREMLLRTPLVVIGERLARRARALGCVRVIATEASDRDIFGALLRIGQEDVYTHQHQP